MAQMIPDTIADLEGVTHGERWVFNVLRDALRPDSDYIAWYEPKSTGKRTDFVLWSNGLGLLVIEVKGWHLSDIQLARPEKWDIGKEGQTPDTRENPVEQARKCFLQFKEMFRADGRLCRFDSRHSGQLRFPIRYCVIFTGIQREQAIRKLPLSPAMLACCLFADDLPFANRKLANRGLDDLPADRSQEGAHQPFSSRIRRLFQAWAEWFSFAPLTPDEFKVLRFLMFPEVRVSNVGRSRLKSNSEQLKVLDLDQERIAKSIGPGHRIVNGVAGSGKTLVLAYRARYLRRTHPDWRIAFVFFTRSLYGLIKGLIESGGQESDSSGIEIFHYHGLVKKLTRANLGWLPGETWNEWNARVTLLLREAIRAGKTVKYDAILIDEAQNLDPDCILSLTELLHEKTGDLILCLDPAQNIFGRRLRYKSAGIKVLGRKPVSLHKNYRNTVEILDLARRFLKLTGEPVPAAGDEEPLQASLFPVDMDRHGTSPVIELLASPQEEIRFVLDEIAMHIDSGECEWREIGVLYTKPPSSGFLEEFQKEFVARFGEDRLFWLSENPESKLLMNRESNTVTFSTVESTQGMDFPVVFLLGLEGMPRSGPDRGEESERKIAYVGMTRAQDVLYIAGTANTGFFKELTAGTKGVFDATGLSVP